MIALRTRLATDGYVVLPTGDVDGFRAVCAELGKRDPPTDVRIVPGETQYPFRPAAVPYHTDHPRYGVVAWYCVEQDGDDGANLLVDARKIIARLPQAAKEGLVGAHVRLIRSEIRLPILAVDPFRFYWVPPLIREGFGALDAESANAIRSFQEELDAVATTGTVPPVRLKKGEALFVNNHLMLHGRRSIASQSRRHLIRECVIGP